MSREVKRFAATFASGATTTSEVDIGKAYDIVMIEMPSATTYNINLQGANATGGNFKRIYNVVADNDAVVTAIEITSATAGTNGAIVPVPYHTQFMKLEAQTAVADGATYYFICVD